MEKTLQERAIEAAMRFLCRQGYEIIDDGFFSPSDQVNFVAKDGDFTVFCQVRVRGAGEGMPSPEEARRSDMEQSAVKWLSAHTDDPDLIDKPIRFDAISLVAVGDHQAMLRHHINCLG